MSKRDVYLRGFSAHPFEGPVDGLQRVLGISRAESEALVPTLPQYVKLGVDEAEAKLCVEALQEFGGRAEMHSHQPPNIPIETQVHGSGPSLLPTDQQARAMPPTARLPADLVAFAPPGRVENSELPPEVVDEPVVPLSDPPTDPAPIASSSIPTSRSLPTIVGSGQPGADSLPAPSVPTQASGEFSLPSERPASVSPSERIIGSVRPPPQSPISAPSSADDPVQPSNEPSTFEVSDSQRPRGTHRSAPSKSLWTPKPVYHSTPPKDRALAITLPARPLLLLCAFGVLLWLLYSFASPG